MKKSESHILQTLAKQFDKHLSKHELAVIENVFRSGSNSNISTPEAYKYAISNGVSAQLNTSENSAASDKNILQQAHLSTLLKNTQLYHTITWIQKVLDVKQIKHLFIKGSLLAFTRYNDSALRPMSDIDVLIEPGKALEAYAALTENGASGQQTPRHLAESDHHLPTLSYNNTLIEVHHSLFPANARYNIPVKDLFENSIIWKKDHVALPGPDPILSIFYIATHLYYTFLRGGLRLSWLYDLKICINDLQPYSDEHIYAIAKKHNLLRPLTFAACLYYCLCGNKLSKWPLDLDKLPNKTVIKRAAKSFRTETQQQTSESYQLIMEQIVEAKGGKAKYKIIKQRITKNGQLRNLQLLKHIFVISYRFFAYIGNTILKALKIK